MLVPFVDQLARDRGPGRVWVTEFDWQDLDTPNDNTYLNTQKLMAYMIMHRK